MKLYIDGDAFPNILKPIVTRAVNRLEIKTVVVSNKPVKIGRSEYLEYVLVGSGADEADNRIVDLIEENDLVITADIPLADRAVSKNAHAMDFRGKLFTEDNISHYLSVRDLYQNVRDSGIQTPGPPPFKQKDAHEFANCFNNFLAKNL